MPTGAYMAKIKTNLPKIYERHQLIDELAKKSKPDINLSVAKLNAYISDPKITRQDLIELCLITWTRYLHLKNDAAALELKHGVSISSVIQADKKHAKTTIKRQTARDKAFEPNIKQAQEVITNIENEKGRPIQQDDWELFSLRMRNLVPIKVRSDRELQNKRDNIELLNRGKPPKKVTFARTTIRNYWEKLTGFPANTKKMTLLK